MATQKVCSRCFKSKEIDDYKGRWRTCTICREYNRNYLKDYNQINPQTKRQNMKDYQKEYYLRNRDNLKQKSKENWIKKKDLLIEANSKLAEN